eukprot:GHVR01024461.1.p1 GENE.GHVR01024461.1~~GHVR01024461.1.p1  ORF type:complete len:116 (+),score=4.41 GHVR01024461.1:124-471(+)
MSSRLEAATKQFGVQILISGSLADILTRETYSYCRQIDCVTVKGSNEPMRLFTVDLRSDHLQLEYQREQMLNKAMLKRYRDSQKAIMWSPRFLVHSMFEVDKDIIQMRSFLTQVR